MNWLGIFSRKKKGSKPSQLENPEMEKLLASFTRTCWPSNYGDHSIGVDTQALKQLKGSYLDEARAAILKALKKSPDINTIIAASALEMTEALPLMTKWLHQIRSGKKMGESPVAYSRLAHALYDITKEEEYLTDLAEAVRVSGFNDIAGSQVIYPLWEVPLTIEILSAVWGKLKKGKSFRDSSPWRENCEDFLRKKLDDPVGQAFLKTLSETEQQEIRSMVAMTKKQRLERNSRFERFVVGRYNKGDVNRYGEYIKVGGSPIAGLTLRCILEGHKGQINSTSWAPDNPLLASAGSDNTVVIWDAEKGDFISIIDGGEVGSGSLASYIWRAAWSSDGGWIAFGAENKQVSVWDVKKDAFLIPPKGDLNSVRDLAWAPGQNSLLYSVSDDTVWIKDIPSGNVKQIFKGYKGRFDTLAWSSDAAFIAAGYWNHNKQENAKSEEASHEILLWDVNKEKVTTRIDTGLSSIRHICWMPDQPILAAAANDGTISIWNMQERRQIASLESHTSSVMSVSFSAGGVLLASTAERDDLIYGTVRLWRTDTWEEVIILKELESAGGALAFHPKLPMLATRCLGNPANPSMKHTASFIRIWDLDFEAFLSNPPFMVEFRLIEAEIEN